MKIRSNMKLRSGKYMRSHDVAVISNKKVKVNYISSGKWDFVVNGFLELWKEGVNESTISHLASWEVSFWKQLVKDAWHVTMGLELWNIGLYMFFTSISPFFMCSIHFQIEKKSSRVTHACIDLLLTRTYRKLSTFLQ